jgi:hypothetical protein
MTFNKATTTNYTRMQQYRMGQVKMCTQGRNRTIIPWQITKHASKEGADEQDKQHAMSDAEVHPPRCHARLDPVQSENKQKIEHAELWFTGGVAETIPLLQRQR